MEFQSQLTEFGLNMRQAQVYLAMLELGPTSIIKLSRKTGIKRTTVYEIMAELEKKGLVAKSQKELRRLYVAESPEKIQQLLKEKQKKFSQLLPFLKSLDNTTSEKPRMLFYEGKDGLKEVYRKTLETSGELVGIVPENAFRYLGEDFAHDYIAKRIQMKVTARVIAPDNEEMKQFKEKDGDFLRSTRLIDPAILPSTIEINISQNKLALMSFKEEMAIIIESEEIARNMKAFFELAWLGADKKNLEKKKKEEDEAYWV